MKSWAADLLTVLRVTTGHCWPLQLDRKAVAHYIVRLSLRDAIDDRIIVAACCVDDVQVPSRLPARRSES